MKSLQKRLYIPRTPTRLYTSPPLAFFDTPGSASRQINHPRIPVEGRTHPIQPALSFLPTSPALPSLVFTGQRPATLPAPTSYSSSTSTAAAKRSGQRYHLDVGAYGIPKRSMHTSTSDMDLAVQVGEDAYFLRDDALGVADGVGGWSKTRSKSKSPSPSALFASRLMHFCSAEVESAVTASPIIHSATHSWSDEEELEDNLEDLQDGLDVLMILERAYTRTLDAHVVPVTQAPTPFPKAPDSAPVPLLSGSSTALLAVLDHVPDESEDSHESNPVIKIAHVGDCMGMLVRGEDIAWRSEEMWWDFNTPVQLGPKSSTTPSSAHTFSLPVQADDILILASDGMSDNLWDEDVLEEVVRVRGAYHPPTATSNSNTTSNSNPHPDTQLLWRRTLPSMLSEALCSRARRISQHPNPRNDESEGEEVPFARRAKEVGKRFSGGKCDDISVLVAVISPS